MNNGWIKITGIVLLASLTTGGVFAKDNTSPDPRTDSCDNLTGDSLTFCNLMESAIGLLTTIRNDQKAMLPTIGQAQSVRLDHEIRCARKFRETVDKNGPLISFTPNFSWNEVNSQEWKELSSSGSKLSLAPGENAYILPRGKMKFGRDHQFTHPIGAIEFARRIDGQIRPSTTYRDNVLLVSSPQNAFTDVVWRIKDGTYGDNENQDLRVAYYVFGGIGTIFENADAPEPCSFIEP